MPHSPQSPPRAQHPRARTAAHTRSAFTLIELLVVVGVIVVMMSLSIPAFNAIRGNTDLTSVVYDMTGLLEQGRAYAMSNNTYVLVGILEVSSTQSTSAAAQPATSQGASSGTGQILMALIASKDGTRPYQYAVDQASSGNPTSLNAWTTATYPAGYGNGYAFNAISKLTSFKDIHMVDLQDATGNTTIPTTGNMARISLKGGGQQQYDIPAVTGTSSTPFGWPIGSPYAKAQFQFSKVIEFDPQGVARVISSSQLDSVPHAIEIGLQPAHGGLVPPLTTSSTGNIIAIQVDGMTGAPKIYRP